MLCMASCKGNENRDKIMSATDNKCEDVYDSTKYCNATADEIAGIRKALDLYCEASVKGDRKIADRLLHPRQPCRMPRKANLCPYPSRHSSTITTRPVRSLLHTKSHPAT